MIEQNKTLYERLGGYDAIAAVANGLVEPLTLWRSNEIRRYRADGVERGPLDLGRDEQDAFGSAQASYLRR
jgi:hypothetical protein